MNSIYTVKLVKVYQGPVCMIEDILCLKIVIGSVNTTGFYKNIGRNNKILTVYLNKWSFISVFLKL